MYLHSYIATLFSFVCSYSDIRNFNLLLGTLVCVNYESPYHYENTPMQFSEIFFFNQKKMKISSEKN